jgi:hypothetical protein
MIISKQKNLEDIIHLIDNVPVFLIGCSECATLCHSGGEEEVLALKQDLEKRNISVTGWIILDPACHLTNDKRLLKSYMDQINRANKIIVLACGSGVQTVGEIVTNKDVLPGTDTLFLAEIERANEYRRRCNLCGECLVDLFGGICPISLCPKSMLNGPCGGVQNGKCEIDQNIGCVWDQIYKTLKKLGKLHLLTKIQPPKEWSKSLEMRRKIDRV